MQGLSNKLLRELNSNRLTEKSEQKKGRAKVMAGVNSYLAACPK